MGEIRRIEKFVTDFKPAYFFYVELSGKSVNCNLPDYVAEAMRGLRIQVRALVPPKQGMGDASPPGYISRDAWRDVQANKNHFLTELGKKSPEAVRWFEENFFRPGARAIEFDEDEIVSPVD